MVKHIAEQLFYRDLANQHQFWYSEEDRPILEEDENMGSYYADANLLLYSLEKKGMLPPFIDSNPDEIGNKNYFTLHWDQAAYRGLCEWENE